VTDPPTDDCEWGRLDKQHVCFVIGLGGLYPSPVGDAVRSILQPEDGVTKRILDIGTVPFFEKSSPEQ
jgi:hypothetical protein